MISFQVGKNYEVPNHKQYIKKDLEGLSIKI